MEHVLNAEGYQVTCVEDGGAVLEALRTTAYDLVLMDVQMPKLDGVEATRQIRAGFGGERNSTVPIVAVTAYALAGDRERFLAAGMNDYISKPIDVTQLRDKVAHWLRTPA